MKPLELDGCVTDGTHESWATLSPCRTYRYALGRAWDPDDAVQRPVFSIIMLNPSTADHVEDDRTIQKCIHFAKQEGCGSLFVRNLFAYRATEWKTLRRVGDPWGPLNDHVLGLDPMFAIRVAGWGALSPQWLRRRAVRSMGVTKMCPTLHVLGLTSDGEPRHPLFLRNASRAVLWSSVRRA